MHKLLKTAIAATAALISSNTAFGDDCTHEKKLHNYIYTKFGVSRTQYRKFKEVGMYLKKAPGVSPMFNLGLGRRLAKPIRAEFNLQYGRLLYKALGQELGELQKLKQKIHLYGAMINGYYDIMPDKMMAPYVTGGIGIGITKNSDLTLVDGVTNTIKSKNLKCFIWNVGAGLRTDLNQRFSLDLGYRYIYLGKTKVVDSLSTPNHPGAVSILLNGASQKIYGHQLLGAISYNF